MNKSQINKAAQSIKSAIAEAKSAHDTAVSSELTVLDTQAKQSLALKLYDDAEAAKEVTIAVYGDGNDGAAKTARSECGRIFKVAPYWEDMKKEMNKLIKKHKPETFRKNNYLKRLATKVKQDPAQLKTAAAAIFDAMTTPQVAVVHAPTKGQVDKWIKQVGKLSVAKKDGVMTKAQRDDALKALRVLKGYL